jgi:glyceraldehyde 3-phosphate dehydrogenase
MKKIAINGIGRIGRKLTQMAMNSTNVEIVAINDIMPIDMAVYFLKYDSTFGTSKADLSFQGEIIYYNGKCIQYSSFHTIEELPWKNKGIDIAVNCSGTNKSKPQLEQYLKLGIPKVILSSPPDSEDIPIVILGYNEVNYKDHRIISNASCTTYCVAPILDVIHRHFGIQFASFTTVHCYTSDQNLQDAYHQDFRRSRAAGVNIIPTTTSATKVIKSIFPELKDKILGSSFRVPVINGSITEFLIAVEKPINEKAALQVFEAALSNEYHQILGLTNEKIVSSDVVGNSLGALIDTSSIEVVDNKIKLNAFYDNESGYTNQLLRLIGKL